MNWDAFDWDMFLVPLGTPELQSPNISSENMGTEPITSEEMLDFMVTDKSSRKRKRSVSSSQLSSPEEEKGIDKEAAVKRASKKTRKVDTPEFSHTEGETKPKSPERWKSFLGDIRAAAHQRKIKQISKEQERSLGLTREEDFAFDLPKVTFTQNPVGRIKEAYYIPYESVKELELDPLTIPIQYEKDELISRLRALKAFAGVPDIESRENLEFLRNRAFRALPEIFSDLTVYQIDELIHSLQREGSEPLRYLDESVLRRKFKECGFQDNLVNPFLEKLTAYVSYYDEIALKGNDPSLEALLEEKAKAVIPNIQAGEQGGYAVKTGLENHREILAQKLLVPMELGKYVLAKVETSLPHVKLGAETNPQGVIGGKWLEGSLPLPREKFDELLELEQSLQKSKKLIKDLRHELALYERGRLEEEEEGKEFSFVKDKKAKIQELSENRIELKKLIELKESEVMEAVGIKSPDAYQAFEDAIRELALIDILFCSYDSNEYQYLIKDGVPICVDFAKFLPPGTVFTTGRNDHQVVMRSYFFDHPSSAKPMSSEMVTKILSWNIDELEALYREHKLIGTEEEFALSQAKLANVLEDTRQLQEVKNEYLNFKDYWQVIERKCREVEAKYGITLQGRGQERYTNVQRYLKDYKHKVQEVAFQKIHPKAFQDFKNRLYSLQQYVQSEKRPTVQKAFGKLYPNIDPFIQVMKRWNPRPGLTINMEYDFLIGIIYHNLEEVLCSAMGLPDMTEKDLNSLQTLLDNLEKETIPHYQLGLAMYVV